MYIPETSFASCHARWFYRFLGPPSLKRHHAILTVSFFVMALRPLVAKQLPLEIRPIKIRRILIDRDTVFGPTTPRHDLFPYSALNKIHIVTKESFIRHEILFKEGDTVNPELLAESERILRSRPIFRYVVIQL